MTMLPTPMEAYAAAQYRYPLLEDMPIVKIPIMGPPPFNMLAYARTLVGIDFGWNHVDTYRRTVTCMTLLYARGYDPQGPPGPTSEPVPVIHSSTAKLRMLQSRDDLEFQFAIDAVHPASWFDKYGRWNVQVDRADREDGGGISGAYLELSSWVMYREPAAIPGAPPAADPGGVAQQAFGATAVDQYRQYLASPNANILKAAEELTRLSGQLAVPPAFEDAVEPQRMVLQALAGFTPTPEGRLDHLLLLNEARHTLIVRLRDADQRDTARELAAPTVDGYRSYAEAAGADLFRVQRDMAELVKPLLAVGAPRQALAAARDALRTLIRIDPEAGRELEHAIAVAEAQHNVVARLIDNHVDVEARELAAVVIRAYERYAGRPGADAARAIRDLKAFASEVLTPGGLVELGAQAAAAAAALEHP